MVDNLKNSSRFEVCPVECQQALCWHNIVLEVLKFVVSLLPLDKFDLLCSFQNMLESIQLSAAVAFCGYLLPQLYSAMCLVELSLQFCVFPSNNSHLKPAMGQTCCIATFVYISLTKLLGCYCFKYRN